MTSVGRAVRKPVSLVVLDWGRTLYYSDAGGLHPAARDVLDHLAGRYQLALVSLAVGESAWDRRRKVSQLGLAGYFSRIAITTTDKRRLFHRTALSLGVEPGRIALVDDRLSPAIEWGNQVGAVTLWLSGTRRSPFANCDSDACPDYVLQDLSQVSTIL